MHVGKDRFPLLKVAANAPIEWAKSASIAIATPAEFGNQGGSHPIGPNIHD
jgi:hypothetical protein